MSHIKDASSKAASKVGAVPNGFDPASILVIVTTVIAGIVECRKLKEPDVEKVHSRLHDEYSRDPWHAENQVRFRVIKAARRQPGRFTREMKSQVDDMVEAVIETGLEMDAPTLMAACNEVG